MTNRRVAIVVGLGVVELWIVGLTLRSVGLAGPSRPAASNAASPIAASPAEPDSQGLKSVETGASPHVVIDDEDATLTVSVRPGSSVVVSDQTRISGWMQGASRPVSIARTSDGLRIFRPDSGLSVSMGFVRRRLDVIVPPQARVDVQNAGSMTVSGLRADVTLHTDDGTVVVRDVRGNVEVKTDDGRIELDDVGGPAVDVATDNGRVTFDRVEADTVAVSTDDGRVDIGRSLLRGGKIQTSNGRVQLGLDPRSDVTVSARASSGRVIAQPPLVRGGSANDDDDVPATIRVGAGRGHLDVASDDGSITVAAGGM
jgi:hypothetical protein